MSAFCYLAIRQMVIHLTEQAMSTGNLLYLVMVLATFGVFSAVLAYQSWRQSHQGPEMLPAHGDNKLSAQGRQEEPPHAIAA